MGVYPVAVVGEQYEGRQFVIAKLKAADRVDLIPEPENPHDPFAIRVETESEKLIGYIGRDSWLVRALYDEGKDLRASVWDVVLRDGFLQVTLSVSTAGEDPASLPGGWASRPDLSGLSEAELRQLAGLPKVEPETALSKWAATLKATGIATAILLLPVLALSMCSRS